MLSLTLAGPNVWVGTLPECITLPFSALGRAWFTVHNGRLLPYLLLCVCMRYLLNRLGCLLFLVARSVAVLYCVMARWRWRLIHDFHHVLICVAWCWLS